jgi:hypothetical protein
MEHINHPHHPGALFNCPACEGTCRCTELGLGTDCVHCHLVIHGQKPCTDAKCLREGHGGL